MAQGTSQLRRDGLAYPTVAAAVPVGGAWFLRAEIFFDLGSAAADARGSRTDFETAQLLADFGWRSPHLLWHGQSFLGLFESRMGAQCLWFMDELEAPLSFRSQLALLGMLKDLVDAGSQFVIATHSPVPARRSTSSANEFASSLRRFLRARSNADPIGAGNRQRADPAGGRSRRRRAWPCRAG